MEPKISYLELLKPFHIKPKNEIYYIEALTHSSYAHEQHDKNLKCRGNSLKVSSWD